MLLDLFSTNRAWLQTLIRITLGVVFFAHGSQKVLGSPFLAVAAEFLAGLGLMVGLFSRIEAVGIGVIMLVAIFMVHGRRGLFLNWLGDRKGHGYEYHVLAIALAAESVVRGSGAASPDRLVYRAIGA